MSPIRHLLEDSQQVNDNIRRAAKQFGLSVEAVRPWAAADPSGSGKYILWLVREAKRGHLNTADISAALAALTAFDKFWQKLPDRNINNYDWERLQEVVTGTAEDMAVERPGLKFIGSVGKYVGYRVTGPEAAAYWRKTAWCVKEGGSMTLTRDVCGAMFYAEKNGKPFSLGHTDLHAAIKDVHNGDLFDSDVDADYKQLAKMFSEKYTALLSAGTTGIGLARRRVVLPNTWDEIDAWADMRWRQGHGHDRNPEKLKTVLGRVKNGVINGDVDLQSAGISALPDLRGVRVTGSFDCSHNTLTSLQGAPASVGGGFNCSSNRLTSLRGAPASVGGNFDCPYNRLTSLTGAPTEVRGKFDCNGNQLTDLTGAPVKVWGDFTCVGSGRETAQIVFGGGVAPCTNLTSLQGAPRHVGGAFCCNHNSLTTLRGGPADVGSFYCNGNQLTSLQGAPKSAGKYQCQDNARRFTMKEIRHAMKGQMRESVSARLAISLLLLD